MQPNELSDQQCSNLTADNGGLINEKTSLYHLQQLEPKWSMNSANDGADSSVNNSEVNSISHTYSFKNYYQTMAFVNVIAQIAHQQDHHPDLLVSYNRCTVTYSTHDVGGLSIKDFICAAKINNTLKL